MGIGSWLLVAFNCAIVCCVVAKPFSLNEIIEAESQLQPVPQTISPKLEEAELPAYRFSRTKTSKPLTRRVKKLFDSDSLLLGKKLSPVSYRKKYQIKIPLKPKRIKPSLRIRQKRKNQSVKREIGSNAKLNKKYIPLLRSLGMLFDNILGADSRESFEINESKTKRVQHFKSDDITCDCSSRRYSHAGSTSQEETVAVPAALSVEVSTPTTVATETTNITPSSDVSGFRSNKNIPVLLPRNTFSARRNDNGFSERSSAPHNRGPERYISRDHGNSQYNPRWGENSTSTKSNERHPDDDSRNGANRVEFGTGIRRDRDGSGTIEEAVDEKDISEAATESFMVSPREYVDESKGQDKLEMGGNETKSEALLSQSVRRIRGYASKNIINPTESVHSKEDDEESHIEVTLNSSDDKRVSYRNGTPAKKDQETSPRHEAVIFRRRDIIAKNNSTNPLNAQVKGPVVVIIDGYSVTRHKNGENKLSEKSIRFRSK